MQLKRQLSVFKTARVNCGGHGPIQRVMLRNRLRAGTGDVWMQKEKEGRCQLLYLSNRLAAVSQVRQWLPWCMLCPSGHISYHFSVILPALCLWGTCYATPWLDRVAKSPVFDRTVRFFGTWVGWQFHSKPVFYWVFILVSLNSSVTQHLGTLNKILFTKSSFWFPVAPKLFSFFGRGSATDPAEVALQTS